MAVCDLSKIFVLNTIDTYSLTFEQDPIFVIDDDTAIVVHKNVYMRHLPGGLPAQIYFYIDEGKGIQLSLNQFQPVLVQLTEETYSIAFAIKFKRSDFDDDKIVDLPMNYDLWFEKPETFEDLKQNALEQQNNYKGKNRYSLKAFPVDDPGTFPFKDIYF